MDISNPEFDPTKAFQEFKKWINEDEILYKYYCSYGIEHLIVDWVYEIDNYDSIANIDQAIADADLLINIWETAGLIYSTSKHSNVYYLFKE